MVCIVRLNFRPAAKVNILIICSGEPDVSRVDGPVTEWTREKAAERRPDRSGNEVMWLKYGLEYSYALTFGMAAGKLSGFTVECKYDADRNS